MTFVALIAALAVPAAGPDLVVNAANSPFVVQTDTNVASLLVDTGGTLQLDATLSVDGDATVIGTVTQARGGAGVRIVAGGVIDVQSTGHVDVSGKGLLGGNQPGNTSGVRGQTVDPVSHLVIAGAGDGNGGSYAGKGAVGSATTPQPPSTYGDQDAPVELGGGGGGGQSCAGGNGGGRAFLQASTVRVNGVVAANGAAGAGACSPRAAGGAGGSVFIVATASFQGAGTVSALGGVGSSNGADGGGGRVFVDAGASSFTGTVSALSAAAGIQSERGSVSVRDAAAQHDLIENGAYVIDGTDAFPAILLATGAVLDVRGAAAITAPLSVPAGTTLRIDDAHALDAIDLASTIGGSVVVAVPFTIAESIVIDGSLVVDARLDVSGGVTVDAGGIVTHDAGVTGAVLATTGDIQVNPGGAVDVSGKGLTSGFSYDATGTIVVTTPAGAGGGHGGRGGANGGGAAYDDPRNPALPGGAGGIGPCAEPGGAGGGVISLFAQTLRVNGALKSDGQAGVDGCGAGNGDSGGGAGGAIVAHVTTLSGTGTISAVGANGENEAGGGGGGSIALLFTTSSFSGSLATSPGGPQSGDQGTVFALSSSGTLVVQGGRTRIDGADAFSQIALGGSGVLEVTGPASVTSPVTVIAGSIVKLESSDALTGIDLDPTLLGSIVVDAPVSLGTTTVGTGGTLVINDALAVGGDLTVLSGGTVTHDVAVDTFDLDVSGTVDVRAGGKIATTAKGLRAGPNAGFATSGAAIDPITLLVTQGAGVKTGGSYGGVGAGPAPASVYGDQEAPDFLGAGGGAGPCSEPGGSGGGRVHLHAAVLQVGGELSANGGNGVDGCNFSNGDSGGGSGGTVSVDVSALRGNGVISADGGIGENELSGGSGGRVHIAFDTSTYTGVIRANGADGGAAGTLRARSTVGGGLAIAGGTELLDGSASFTSVTIGIGATAVLVGPAHVAAPIAVPIGATLVIASSDALDHIDLSPAIAGTLRIDADIAEDDDVVLSGTLVLNHRLQVKSLDVQPSGRVTHDQGVVTSELLASGTVQLRANARFDATARGLLGAPQADLGAAGATIDPITTNVVAGSGGKNGGSHIGSGGAGDAAQPVAPAYDDADAPHFPGGGGGQGPCAEPGGDGGGVFVIGAARLINDGVIVVDGSNGVDGCNTANGDSGGGAGGTVAVNVDTLAGVGIFAARGGTADNESGGGAGGAVALSFATSTFTGQILVTPGGPVSGAAGSSSSNPPNLAPHILTAPPVFTALGAAFHYAPLASGTRPLTWSLTSAPTGAVVDIASGTVDWTPPSSAPGTFTLHVDNGAGFDEQTFVVTPGGVQTTPPHITSSASLVAFLGVPYAYDDDDTVTATGDAPITWSASLAPANFGIDPTTGVVAWTPDTLGEEGACVVATNSAGSDTQCFTLQVQSASPPVFTSVPLLLARVGEPYVYDDDGAASATGAAPIAYSVVTAPTGFAIDAASGAVTWTPDTAGHVDVTLRASNDIGDVEQSFNVAVLPNAGGAPVIVRAANPVGALGVPYVYDDDGAADAGGDAPITWSMTSGPAGFAIEATTGVVSWTPRAAGSATIALRAQNAHGSDDYTFTVDVADAASAPPTASAIGAPVEGDAPLSVSFDASASASSDSSPLALVRWTFGDGAPPSFTAIEPHVYDQPGSYIAKLHVADRFGATADGTVPIAVLDHGVHPPRARILISEVSGNRNLAVSLSCDCVAGDSPTLSILWDFGDGEASALPAVTHSFGPGGFEVRLSVVDGNGLTASDSVVVTVTDDAKQPPVVVASATPTFGAAPLVVQFNAIYADPDGEVATVAWDFGDGGTSGDANPQYTYAAPADSLARVTVTDSDGLTATAAVEIEVGNAAGVRPPGILSLPNTDDDVGVAYSYDEDGLPAARGDRPLTWTLGKTVGGTVVGVPAGMTIDALSGEIHWTPTTAGTFPVTLVASNAAGATAEDWQITVAGAGKPKPKPSAGGCGCGTSSSTAPFFAGLAALLLLRARRRVDVGASRK